MLGAVEILGWDKAWMELRIEQIYATLLTIYKTALQEKVLPTGGCQSPRLEQD